MEFKVANFCNKASNEIKVRRTRLQSTVFLDKSNPGRNGLETHLRLSFHDPGNSGSASTAEKLAMMGPAGQLLLLPLLSLPFPLRLFSFCFPLLHCCHRHHRAVATATAIIAARTPFTLLDGVATKDC